MHHEVEIKFLKIASNWPAVYSLMKIQLSHTKHNASAINGSLSKTVHTLKQR